MNSYANQNLKVYKLEPGDATRYVFGVASCIGMGDVISGIGDGNLYVMVTIMMSGAGVAVLPIYDLLDVQSHAVGYALGHGLGACNTYTVAAVLLAVSALSKDPSDLEGAAREMLRAPELLADL